MHRTLKDNNLKVRALRRARELREVLKLLSFFLPFSVYMAVHSTIWLSLSRIIIET